MQQNWTHKGSFEHNSISGLRFPEVSNGDKHARTNANNQFEQ